MRKESRVVFSGVLVLSVLGCCQVHPASVLGRPLSKRSFFDVQCKGVYDRSIFARLDRICEDCYNLFKEPQLHSPCRGTSSGGGKVLQEVTRNDSRRPVVVPKGNHLRHPSAEDKKQAKHLQEYPRRFPMVTVCFRRNCFTTDYFKGCLDALLLQDEVENIQTWIKQLHGADPGV